MYRLKAYIDEELSRKKSAGNFIATDKGAGMTAKGVKAYRAKNPGSKLKTAVTTKPLYSAFITKQIHYLVLYLLNRC